MEVSDQPHALATLPLVPTEQEARWAPQPVLAFWRRDKSLAPASIQKAQTIQPIA